MTPLEVHAVSSVRDINSLLRAMQYVPRCSFNGPDKVMLRVKQPEGSVDQEIEETIAALPVFVLPVYQLPRWKWVTSETNVSTLRLEHTNPQRLPHFEITEAQDECAEPSLRFFDDDTVLRARVFANTGTLLHDVAATTVEHDGVSVTLQGRVDDLRAALAQIRFQYSPPPPHSSSTATTDLVDVVENRMVIVTFTVVSQHLYHDRGVLEEITAQRPHEPVILATLHLDIDASLTWTPRVFKREEVTLLEDHPNVTLSDSFDLSDFDTINGAVEIKFTAVSGRVFIASTNTRSSDEVLAAPVGSGSGSGSSLKITVSNGKQLRKAVAGLYYSPRRDFSGIDRITCRVLEQESELVVRVVPVNDAPHIVFTQSSGNVSNASSSERWFMPPMRFLPALLVEDPDDSDAFDVQIDAANGSLKWWRKTPRELFDGVTMTGVGTSSLQVKSTLARVNALLSQPQLRFVATENAQAGGVRICVHDGTARVCEELQFSIEPLYSIHTLTSDADLLRVTRDEVLNLSSVIQVVQHFARASNNESESSDEPVALQIDTSTGATTTRRRSPSLWNDVSCARIYESKSELLGGATQFVYATNLECAAAALAKTEFHVNPMDASDLAHIRVQLFNAEKELVATGDLDLHITPWTVRSSHLVVSPPNGSASTSPPLASDTWSSTYTQLAAFANVRVQQSDPHPDTADIDKDEEDDDGRIMELAFACARCSFFYATYVPGVSYENAATQGASAMRFIGREGGLNQVLAMLQVDLPERAADTEAHARKDFVQLSLSPYVASTSRLDSKRRAQLGWNDSAAIPIVVFASEVSSVNASVEASPPLGDTSVQARALASPTLVLTTSNHSQLADTALQAVEDLLVDLPSWVTVQGASDSTQDDSFFVVKVAVTSGKIRVKRSVCCIQTTTTRARRGVDILGTAAAVQVALDSLQYQGDSEFAGNDTLRATIERADEYADERTEDSKRERALETSIVVAPANDPPVVRYRPLTVLSAMKGSTSTSSLFSLEDIEISDIDVETTNSPELTLSSIVRVNLSSELGEIHVDPVALNQVTVLEAVRSLESTAPTADTAVQGVAGVSVFSTLVFEAELNGANALLRRSLFDAKRTSARCLTGANDISVTVDDRGHGVATWPALQTSTRITGIGCSYVPSAPVTAPQITLPLDPKRYLLYNSDEASISIAGLTIVGADESLSNPASPAQARVTGTSTFKVNLEIQRVAIRASRQAQALLLTIWDPNGSGTAPVTGTFTLQADLAFAGIHVRQTAVVYADAVAMRSQEILGERNNGRSNAESIEAKLTQLYTPLQSARLQFHVDRVLGSLPVTARAQWRISVADAPLLLQAPQIVSQTLSGVGAGATVSCVSSVVGAPLGGSFRLLLGEETTREIPASAGALEIQDALEDLSAADAVKVSMTPPKLSAGEVTSWLVTFFSPAERVPLLVGNASALVPDAKMSDADASVTLVNRTSISVERVSAGRGQGDVVNVFVGVTRIDPVYRIVTSATSSITGAFTLAFQDARTSAVLAPTSAISSSAVAMRVDEGRLQSFGGRAGDSMQSKLTQALTQLPTSVRQWNDVRVECTRGDPDAFSGYEWRVTFKGAPPDFPLLTVAAADKLGGNNARVVLSISQSSNKLGGSFQLSYGRSRTTDLLPADSSPDAVEIAINAALSSSGGSATLSSRVGRVIVRKARVDGPRAGFSYALLFVERSSSASATALAVVADGTKLTGIGALARADAVQTHSSDGSFEFLASRFADTWSGDLIASHFPDAFTLDGCLASLRLALGTIVYKTPQHWHGVVQLQFALESLPNDRNTRSKRPNGSASPEGQLQLLSRTSTSGVALEYRLPAADVTTAGDPLTLTATAGLPRSLGDFSIQVPGVPISTWFNLRVQCDRGQFSATKSSEAWSSSSTPATVAWVNGTLAQIHARLQSSATYTGERGSTEFDSLQLSLSWQGVELVERAFLIRILLPPVIPQIHITNTVEGASLWKQCVRPEASFICVVVLQVPSHPRTGRCERWMSSTAICSSSLE